MAKEGNGKRYILKVESRAGRRDGPGYHSVGTKLGWVKTYPGVLGADNIFHGEFQNSYGSLTATCLPLFIFFFKIKG